MSQMTLLEHIFELDKLMPQKKLAKQIRKQDELIYHEIYEAIDHPVYCGFCHEMISGPAYMVDDPSDNYSFHKSCAELPWEIQHPLHPQHALRALEFSEDAPYGGFICDGCRHYSWGIRYCCGECNFKLDVQCVSKLESQQLALKERIEIATDIHGHKLQLFYCHMFLSTEFDVIDIICCCCSKGFQGSAYACVECNIFIHESCIDKAPKQIESPFHQKHSLLLDEPYRRNFNFPQYCHACAKAIRGLMLCCEKCLRYFHVSCCTQATSGLRLEYHEEHPMLYVYMPDHYISRMRKCVVCNTKLENCASYCCLDCEVYVHIECIPLPRVVKHECHPYHALTLSDSTHVLKIATTEYRCVVCEKEGDLKHHFYYCEDEECFDIAHIDCVLSEEDPPSEILEYLLPWSGEKSELEEKTYGYESKQVDKAKQHNNIDSRYDKSARGKDKVQEPEEQKESESELEDCSQAEIDKNIADIKEKMDNLTKELEVLATELEVLQEIRAKK